MAPTNNLNKFAEIPLPPSDGPRYITYTQYVPSWLQPIAIKLSNGLDEAENGITFDVQGNLIFYRKLTALDRLDYPILGDADELWITLDMPTI